MKSIRLNNKNISLISNAVHKPEYERTNVKSGIAHIGVGGFHRAHQAYYIDQLLGDEVNADWGICGISLLKYDTKIYSALKEQEGLYTLIVKRTDGLQEKRVIGSIIENLFGPENPLSVIDKIADKDIKILTLTITEGGYNYNEANEEFDFDNPLIKHDLKFPEHPKTVFGYLTQGLKQRMELGNGGLTILSCDNVQGNGNMARRMLKAFIEVAEPQLSAWVDNHVTFPNSMVDRITPVTVEADKLQLLETTGIEDHWPVVCEPFIQWIIEDDFVAGRPPLENYGVQFVDNVEVYERMKLSLLNAGHSVIGILGALMGYESIDEAVIDPLIHVFLRKYMDDEVTPTLGDIEGIDLMAYKDLLLERFANKNIKDQIDRICSESSAKYPIFILPTINSQLKNNCDIKYAAFLTAAWAHYLLGNDEYGTLLNIKDNMKEVLMKQAKESVNQPEHFLGLTSIFGNLSMSQIFVDVYTSAYNDITQMGIKASIQELAKSNITDHKNEYTS